MNKLKSIEFFIQNLLLDYNCNTNRILFNNYNNF